MALHYFSYFSTQYGSRNFGDDINPWFLPRLFRPDIIRSDRICLVGIGTILNDKNAQSIAHFDRKIVFTSGVGYGQVGLVPDDTWDFVCVRGPRSAEALGLAPETGICDGAILLGDLYPPKRSSARDGIVFIPHVRSGWTSGIGLSRICRGLSIGYLTPDVPFETFIETVRSARLVITEAMHGAILADALRTPWIPVAFLHHHQFKWQDWFASIELPYQCHFMRRAFRDKEPLEEMPVKALARDVYRRLKQIRTKQVLRKILRHAAPVLSTDDVLADRKRRLMDRVRYINDTHLA